MRNVIGLMLKVYPRVESLKDLTGVDIKASSRQAMIASLTGEARVVVTASRIIVIIPPPVLIIIFETCTF